MSEIMARIRLRRCPGLDYKDPKEYLARLRAVELLIARRVKDEKVRTLRTRGLRVPRECREAALFCYGISSCVLQTPMEFAYEEASDHDCVFRRIVGDTAYYTPVQLKEIVPVRLNPQASLDEELRKLQKYRDSEDLVVAIHMNQVGRLNLRDIAIPKLNLAEVWLYGAASQDLSMWWLFGDLLETPSFYEFQYPQPTTRLIALVAKSVAGCLNPNRKSNP